MDAAHIEAGLRSPPSSPFLAENDGSANSACPCMPRNAMCLALYTQILVSAAMFTLGAYGLIAGLEDKCTYQGYITFVSGFWFSSAVANVVKKLRR